MNDDDKLLADEALALRFKSLMDEIENNNLKVCRELEKEISPDIARLVRRRVMHTNFDLYAFIHEIFKSELGADRANKIFVPKYEPRK
ncbi:MAG: hypothetical protein RIA71_10540 [Oceanicaulis sp.]